MAKFPVSAGYPDNSSDGLNKLIPVIFSGKALKRFYEATCLSKIANTEYTGEIKDMGDRIEIATIPDVPIRDYVKGQLLDIDYLESPAIEMVVDKGKSFNFAMDDVDLKQVKIKDWMSKYADNAAVRMKIEIERDVWADIYSDAHSSNVGNAAGAISGDVVLGTVGSPLTITKTNVLEAIIDAGQVLTEQNIPEDGRWMIIPAWMRSLLMKSDIKDASLTGDDKSPLRNGRVGIVDTFELFVSNLVYKEPATSKFHILFGHNSALSFATQLTKVEKYRPERSFSDAIKGLNVHGWKVLQEKALGEIVGVKG